MIYSRMAIAKGWCSPLVLIGLAHKPYRNAALMWMIDDG